ncbi:hypothetical protein [Lysobacter capsici]|uniref:hypothetical protein n=1 Tax=Lysobacter capsici TaxID=435897 RepID=UPI001C0075B2|nr:hypothetical protein [Lysobacter capsici]QWF18134.1 hypothetical protein KME82_05030 [Lysobacter capsici]
MERSFRIFRGSRPISAGSRSISDRERKRAGLQHGKKVSFAGNSARANAANPESPAGGIVMRSERAKIATSYFLPPSITLRSACSKFVDTSFMQRALSVRAARDMAARVDTTSRDAAHKPIVENRDGPSTIPKTVAHSSDRPKSNTSRRKRDGVPKNQ